MLFFFSDSVPNNHFALFPSMTHKENILPLASLLLQHNVLTLLRLIH